MLLLKSLLFSKVMGLINMFAWTDADTNNSDGALEHIETLLDHPHNSNPRPANAAALLRHEEAATSAGGGLDADSRGSDATTPPGTAAPEEKPLPECLSLLPRSDCRETGASGGSQVKTIIIRLPDVEAAMLIEVQKRDKEFRDLQGLLLEQIRQENQRVSARG